MQDGVNDRRWPCAPCIKAFDGCGKPQLRWKGAKVVVSGKVCTHRSNNKYLVFAESRRIQTSAHSVIADTSGHRWLAPHFAMQRLNRSMMKFVRQ